MGKLKTRGMVIRDFKSLCGPWRTKSELRKKVYFRTYLRNHPCSEVKFGIIKIAYRTFENFSMNSKNSINLMLQAANFRLSIHILIINMNKTQFYTDATFKRGSSGKERFVNFL